MKIVDGTWLRGPALQLLKQANALKPGDFVKISGVSYEAYGIPRNVSKIGILLAPPLTASWIRASSQWVYLYGASSPYVLSLENIRAWMRKPLDLEL